jgi:hypothetical protein
VAITSSTIHIISTKADNDSIRKIFLTHRLRFSVCSSRLFTFSTYSIFPRIRFRLRWSSDSIFLLSSTRLETFLSSCCSKQYQSMLPSVSTSLLPRLLPLTDVSVFTTDPETVDHFRSCFSLRGGNGRTIKIHVRRHSTYSSYGLHLIST